LIAIDHLPKSPIVKLTSQILVNSFALLVIGSTLSIAEPVQAVGVSPKGVNVKSFGATTIFLTYFGLNNQTPSDALWCGQINADQSCVPGTVFGRLPSRYNIGRTSGQNNYTDIMTIPSSVARKAYQAALNGNNSEFFYVRRWSSTTGGPDEFVAVTCRLTSGGARVPFGITSVKLQVADKPAPAISTGATLPQFGAQISYNGTGRLKGRWEVVLPGDPLPTQRDLLTEASLPLEERGLQRRYTQLERFDLFLQPDGQVFLPGPDPEKFPQGATGGYQILLRIEATDDKEGDSSIGTGIANSGGVAGFPLPVFRFFKTANLNQIALLTPQLNSQIASGEPIRFSWRGISAARGYKLEVKDGDRVILSALLSPKSTTYTAPPWLKQRKNTVLTWQVQALDRQGLTLTESALQQFQILGQ
jgi:hypothetical protein